jgi:hypothetical protein
MGHKTSYTKTTGISTIHTVDITNTHVSIKYSSPSQEGQFSVADQTGRVVKKGLFIGTTKVSLEGITPGYYSLVLFNEYDRNIYPLRID